MIQDRPRRMGGIGKCTRLLAMSLLLVALAIPCMGVIGLVFVTKDTAKEFGIEVRGRLSGTDAVAIDMEFPLTGKFKEFVRVDLQMTEPLAGVKKGGEPGIVLSVTLREDRSKPDRASVYVYGARANLDQMTLRIISGQPMMYTGYDVRLKDFVDISKLK